jgi:hypothetical protein
VAFPFLLETVEENGNDESRKGETSKTFSQFSFIYFYDVGRVSRVRQGEEEPLRFSPL